jgi:hypothetical protein
MSERPAIPAKLRRRILVEAGHRCAIPTCRHIEIDVHHIIPWEQCKEHCYENLIALCPNCHRRAGRGDIDRESLRIYKANLRFAHDKLSQLEIDTLFALCALPDRHGLPWPAFLNLLLKRLFDAAYVKLVEMGASISIGNIKTNPDILQITPSGREFINSLGLREL